MQLKTLIILTLACILAAPTFAIVFEWDIAVQGGAQDLTGTVQTVGVGPEQLAIPYPQTHFLRHYSYNVAASALGCSGRSTTDIAPGLVTEVRNIPGAGSNRNFAYPKVDSVTITVEGTVGFVGGIGSQQRCDYSNTYNLKLARQTRRVATDVTAAEGAKALGQIGPLSLVALQPGEEFVVISRNPQAKVWMGTPTSQSVTATGNAGFTVYACEDLNQDGTCDTPAAAPTPTPTPVIGTPVTITNISVATGQNTTAAASSPQTLLALDFMLIPPQTQSASFARWAQTQLRFTWDNNLDTAHFCLRPNQCLVTAAGAESRNDQPEFFFRSVDAEKPKCLADEQFVLDHLCQDGAWTSRTLDVFLNLADLAQRSSPDNFSITCAESDTVFNDVSYVTSQGVRVADIIGQNCQPGSGTQDHPCINNACVLQYANGVAFGTSLNEPINSPKSFLKTLNLSTDFCDNVANPYYEECSPGVLAQEKIYFNPYTESLLFVQNDQVQQINAQQVFDTVVKPRQDEMRDYVARNTNDTFLQGYYRRPISYSHIALHKRGAKEIFGFKAESQSVFRYDYGAITYTNIDLGQNPCSGFVKLFDDRAFCEQQPTAGKFFVIGQGTGAKTLANVWLDMTSKVRP
jgi:hypothetical protein